MLEALLQALGVRLAARLHGRAAMHLERTERRDEDERTRPDVRLPALDVEELLAPQVEAEACLRDGVVAERHREPRRDHAVAAVRDVAERAAMDDRRAALFRLDQVRLERIAQHRRHRARSADVTRGDRLAVVRVRDDDAREALLQVLVARREREDRHDLARGGDVEALLARSTVRLSTEADDASAEEAVVHVERAAPADLPRIDLALVRDRLAEVRRVVDERGQKVVRRRDRVDVASEVEVDVVGGRERRLPTAGAPALHSEDRPQGRLAEREDGVHPEAAHAHRERDGGRRLPLPGRGRVDRGDEDEAPLAARRASEKPEIELRLSAAVRDVVVGTKA